MSLTIHSCRAFRTFNRDWVAICVYTLNGRTSRLRATGSRPGPIKWMARAMVRQLARQPRGFEELLREGLAKLPASRERWGGRLVAWDFPVTPLFPPGALDGNGERTPDEQPLSHNPSHSP